MITAPLTALKRHPGQMRTTYDLEKMAALTLQIYERNLDEWQPIVATPNGEGYHIISGHRRHMACLFAFALDDWREKQKSTEGPATIETVREMLSTLVNKHGDVETAAEALIAHYGEREISFALFEGDEKSQILALQAANFGGEDPDVMGVALSFRLALVAGATIEQIARNAGVHVRYVENHLALTEIPRALAERIAAGGLPMSVAATVADMPDPRRSGLALFILANPAGSLTAREIKECAAELKKWPGLQMPLTTAHQAQRNIARALVQLWGQVIDAYPEDAWAAAAMLVYRGQHLAPWADAAKTSLWFQVLGGETYYGDDGVHWAKVVAHLLNEVSCKACPVAQLPQQQLQSDLGQGQRGALGMPCRIGEQAARCIHGLAPDDPFDVRVPWGWSEHEVVVHEGGHYRVKSLEALQQAWQAQAQLEAAENSARAEPAIDEPGDGEVTIDQSHNAAAQAVTQTKGPGSPSLIEKQRELIADFMQQHLKLIDTHPMATACRRCRHRLESSPTKDESVPHCAWAGRLRNVAFKTWQPTGGNGPVIPVCRQFAPVENWPDIIPEHPQPPGVPREWLKQTILQLVEACGNFGAGRQPFEFLTGRPMSGSEHYNTWFADQLNEQVGNLSDGQLWTLFTWAVSEWQRAKKHDCFTMPVNGSGAQFLDYQEVKWQLQAGAEQGRREAAS
jgi:hypothetical protein